MSTSPQEISTPAPPIFQSERLTPYEGVRIHHGFTGRPLSLGGPNQSRETILKNRCFVASTLHCHSNRLSLPHQVHGNTVKHHQDEDLSASDALILDQANHPAMVLTADCVPMIFYDPITHTGAVVHAGWRGTAQSIAISTVRAMEKRFGITPTTLIAVMGPSICGTCYEVDDSVHQALEKTLMTPTKNLPEPWFQRSSPGAKPTVDLRAVNAQQLRQVGVMNIDMMGWCTACHNDRFWSYRKGDEGRQGAVLELLP